MKTVNLNEFTDEHGGIYYLDNEGNIYEPDENLDGLGKFGLFKKIGNIFKKKPGGSKVGNFFRRTLGKEKTEGLVVDELQRQPRESALLTTVADTINQNIVRPVNSGNTPTYTPNLPPPPKDNDKLIKGLAIGGAVLVAAGGAYALANSKKRKSAALSGTSKKKKSRRKKRSPKKKPTTRRTKTKKAA